jgi:hypothetical protein
LTGSRYCRILQILTANPEEEVKVFLQPWQLLLLVLAGWVNRRQQDVIECLLAENQVLRQKLGKRRNHAERNHQGMENQLLLPGKEAGMRSGEIACRERLGGLLHYYYRVA